jgi:hypothetical protein
MIEGAYAVKIVPRHYSGHDDNVDVDVYFDECRYRATFFTTRNIQSIMRSYRQTGECAGGRYFWAAAAIIVDRIDQNTVETVVADLLRSGEFESAFSGPHPADAELQW